jgi:hypothetical protein
MSTSYVVLTSEEAASNIDLAQVELDMSQVELDLARAHSDHVRSDLEMQQTDSSVPQAVLDRLTVETQAAAAVVAELEADAEARGIPTSLIGSLYRIYNTAAPLA